MMAKAKGRRFPSEDQDRFMVRLPEGMRDKIAEAAGAARRTMNAEIVARLERSFMHDAEPKATGGLQFIKAARRMSDQTTHAAERRLAKLEREVAELKKSRS